MKHRPLTPPMRRLLSRLARAGREGCPVLSPSRLYGLQTAAALRARGLAEWFEVTNLRGRQWRVRITPAGRQALRA